MSAAQAQLRPIITSPGDASSSTGTTSITHAPLCLSPSSELPSPGYTDIEDRLTFAKISLPCTSHKPLHQPGHSARSSMFAGTFTDSEAPSAPESDVQSTGNGYGSTNPSLPRLPRSPSLLSSLFASQPPSGASSTTTSRHNSTSAGCSTALNTPFSPLSPVSSHPYPVVQSQTGPAVLPAHVAFACASTAKDCKPILRRTGGVSTDASVMSGSASTSASEDNGPGGRRGYRSASATGLGLSGTASEHPSVSAAAVASDCVSDAAVTTERTGEKKCSLKFAVKPCFPQGSFSRSSSTGCYDAYRSALQNGAGPSRRYRSRSPDPSRIEECEWEDIRTPGLDADGLEALEGMDGDSSDDEGYEEDEEGGFTSDEDELGAFAAQARLRSGAGGLGRFAWATRRGHGNGLVPDAHGAGAGAGSIGLATPRRRTAIETYCTTDDNAPEPIRGRKISIAARTTDKCSRHLSPPPRSPSPEYAPPAARSPSARELCMRRARVMSDQADEPVSNATRVTGRGWRSDGVDGGMFGSTVRSQTAPLPMDNGYASVLPSVLAPGSAIHSQERSIGDQVEYQARKASLPTLFPTAPTGCKSILRCSDASSIAPSAISRDSSTSISISIPTSIAASCSAFASAPASTAVSPLASPKAPFAYSTTHSRVASPRHGLAPLSLSGAPSSPRNAGSPRSAILGERRKGSVAPLSPMSTGTSVSLDPWQAIGTAAAVESRGGAREGLQLALNGST